MSVARSVNNSMHLKKILRRIPSVVPGSTSRAPSENADAMLPVTAARLPAVILHQLVAVKVFRYDSGRRAPGQLFPPSRPATAGGAKRGVTSAVRRCSPVTLTPVLASGRAQKSSEAALAD